MQSPAPNPNPLVTLAPRMNVRGWHGTTPSSDAPRVPVVDLKTALTTRYAGDVYILGYAPQTGPTYVRLTASSLAQLRLQELAGAPHGVVLNVALIDVDGPGHKEGAPPPDGWREAQVEAARAVDPALGWYHTRRGLRLVYLPAAPVPLGLADSYLRALVARLSAGGVEGLDPTTAQCLRLMRAPRALNLDLPLDFSALRPTAWTPRPDELAERTAAASGPIVAYPPGSLPVHGGRVTKEELKPVAKADAVLARALATGGPIADQGSRHGALVEAACLLAKVYATNDPAFIYGLLLSSVRAMFAGEAHTRDVEGELRSICEWAAARWAGAQAEATVAKRGALDRAASAMACSPDEVWRRLIVDASQEFFVWDEEAEAYSPGYNADHQLDCALKTHCPSLLGWLAYESRAKRVIFRDYATAVQRVAFSYMPVSPQLDVVAGTYTAQCVRVDPTLRPRYHADVAAWLTALGGEHHSQLLDWLASAPKLDKPICALYLDAEQGVGKSMLTMGLARIWSKDSLVVAYAEATGGFQDTLLRSPIIVAEEKIASASFQDSDSSVFRRIIGNRIQVRALYRAPVSLASYPRLIVAANNSDALHIREDMNTQDIEAVRIRVGYIRVHDEPRRVLEALAHRGGFKSSSDMTQSWVSGGAIAEHVLHLHDTREVLAGHRLLVEGWVSDLTRDLGTKSGAAGPVGEAIALAITKGLIGEAVRWFGGRAYVSNPALGAAWRDILGNAESAPRSASRLSAIKALARDQQATLDRPGSTPAVRKQARYWVIDGDVLARVAEDRGVCTEDQMHALLNRATEQSTAVEAAIL